MLLLLSSDGNGDDLLRPLSFVGHDDDRLLLTVLFRRCLVEGLSPRVINNIDLEGVHPARAWRHW